MTQFSQIRVRRKSRNLGQKRFSLCFFFCRLCHWKCLLPEDVFFLFFLPWLSVGQKSVSRAAVLSFCCCCVWSSMETFELSSRIPWDLSLTQWFPNFLSAVSHFCLSVCCQVLQRKHVHTYYCTVVNLTPCYYQLKLINNLVLFHYSGSHKYMCHTGSNIYICIHI